METIFIQTTTTYHFFYRIFMVGFIVVSFTIEKKNSFAWGLWECSSSQAGMVPMTWDVKCILCSYSIGEMMLLGMLCLMGIFLWISWIIPTSERLVALSIPVAEKGIQYSWHRMVCNVHLILNVWATVLLLWVFLLVGELGTTALLAYQNASCRNSDIQKLLAPRE